MKATWLFGALVCAGAVGGEAPDFIRHLGGCFQVSYHYVEEGDAVFPAYREGGYEYVKLTQNDETYTLQHWGFGGKHWGQIWKRVKDDVWHQAVTDPFGKVRYECTGKLVTGKGVAQRRCEASGAPMPRRDRIAKRDYDVLDRVHVYNISEKAWQDVQQNAKRKGEKIVATEIGWNEYRRVDDEHCAEEIRAAGD